ncbi:hypothetical protein ABL78_7223 [Leptomonas seymouri]|uniref:Uncharacterized protein n=1 Tax=Leptomonas seymouri TaxID=5684 RepID=A0A0N0P354_LEPSE|nr:hypothetical protein ABL78_7223 [Leptomonas seymouri]|eukprot:KPI83736.1 hypothetical protein ABL78_7223 [Leptomonas seymouri]
MPSPAPYPKRMADPAEVPIAVRPYDVDGAFLSKSIVSLRGIFSSAVDSRFDLSPLPETATVKQPNEARKSAAAQTPASHSEVSGPALPFSGGSQPYVTSTPRGGSSSSPTFSVQQYSTVAQTADAHRDLAFGSSEGKDTTPPCSATVSSEASAAPQLIVAPIDAHHLLLSFRGAGLAEPCWSTLSRSEADKGNEGFAAATRRATSSVERLSAHAPGPRPPRNGVSVVRREEGEMQSGRYLPTAAPAADGKTVYPTLSRIAQGLPFCCFDGWVRDYTAYGLSRNAAALRGAWEDKLHERAESPEAAEEGPHGDVVGAHPAGTVIEAVTSVVSADVSVDTVVDNTRPAPPPTGLFTATDDDAATERSILLGKSATAVSQDGCDEDQSRGDIPMEPETAAATAAGAVGVAPPPQSLSNAVVVAGSAADSRGGKERVAVEAKVVSSSLERLNCSSTTTSSSAGSSCSPPADCTTTKDNGNSHMDEETKDAAGEAEATNTPTPLLRQARLWSDELRREARISSQLAHRFIVSDSIQNAIWAIEVTLPAMQVRVVAPAAFYRLADEIDGGDAVQGPKDNSTRDTAADCSRTTADKTLTVDGAEVRMPRKKPATAVTQACTRTSGTSHAHASAHPATPSRSPSPEEPQSARHNNGSNDEDVERDSSAGSLREARTSVVDVSPSCQASVATQVPHGASPSLSQSRHRTHRSRSSTSVNSSVALAEAVPTPLIGGARGFVDGHFSVARFNAPGALCWRLDGDATADEAASVAAGSGAGQIAEDPLRDVQRRSCCTVLFISDVGNCAIRYANFHNRLVRTIAGMDGVPGYRDGSCTSSLLRGATALAWCSAGLLFTDGPNSVVRLITHVNRPTRSCRKRVQTSQGDGPARHASCRKESESHQNSDDAFDDEEEAQKTEQHVDETSGQPAQLPERSPAAPTQSPSEDLASSAAAHRATNKSSALIPTSREDGLATLCDGVSTLSPETSPAAPAASTDAQAVLAEATETDNRSTSVATTPPLPPPAPSNVRAPIGHLSEGRAPSGEASRDAKPSVVPRVWTLAGCARSTYTASADTGTNSDISSDAVDVAASYVDCRTPSHACFGYLSDMALWADETGSTQLYLLDQTHHAVRVLDVDGGVSTYVGPLDYASPAASTQTKDSQAASSGAPLADALPSGLVYPSSLAMAALIKERLPALIDHTDASALTPQSYLYSSTPLLFVASAITGVVSVLLPISQRSELVSWNAMTAPQQLTQGAKGGSAAALAFLQQIHSALSLGIATEGRRTIGEATAPSLKHVVTGWGIIDDNEREAHSDDGAAQTQHLLRHARLQQALLYLRLRFPWVLPPAVPQLSSRLVAGCTCHISGKRRGTAAQRHLPTSFVHQGAAQSSLHADAGPCASSLPRSNRSSLNGRCGGNSGDCRGTSASASPTRRPMQPHRLLFSTPPRHPTAAPYAQLLKDPRIVAAAKEVADLLLVQPSTAVSAPCVVEVQAADAAAPLSELRRVSSPSHDPQGGEDAAAAEPEPHRARSVGSSPSDDALHAVEEEHRDTTVEDAVDVGVSGHTLVDLHGDGREPTAQQELKTRSGAALKWLPPPTKSVSRSPVSTPQREAAAAEATALTKAGCLTPLQPSPSSYAHKFQTLPAEQRQLRLLHTLEELTPRAGDAAVQRELSASPPPQKAPSTDEVRQHKARCRRNERKDDNGADDRESSESDGGVASLRRSSRECLAPSHSPNSSSRGASPPCTPRSMAAHQLMQRRRTSRSSTAPHVTSVGSTAGIGNRASQEQGRGTSKGSAAALKNAGSSGNDEDEERREGALRRDRSPSHTVHEAREAALTAPAELRAALVHPMKLSMLHDVYDAAVRRLFRIYAYFATRTVTHAVAAGTRRLSREVEHYSMSFSAFYRFATLTGYLDYLADVAAAVTSASQRTGDMNEETPLWKWSMHLTQVQRRGVASAAARPGPKSISLGRGSSRLPANFSKSPASPSGPSSAPSPQQLLLLPLAVSDSRAVADVLYSCGVRTQGYHVVACMDFQSFRRAVLLLRTWALTAHEQEERRKRGTAAADVSVNLAHHGDQDAKAFAYLDSVPSLDVLSAEEVVAAYSEVYAQATRTVPALQSLNPGGWQVRSEKEGGEGHQQLRSPTSVVAGRGAPQPSTSTGLSYPRPLKDVMGLSTRAAGSGNPQGNSGSGSNTDSDSAGHHPQRPQTPAEAIDGLAAAATPPLSPISSAGDIADFSGILDEADNKESPAGDGATPPYLASTLTLEGRLALDDLLRLLQRNEGTLRQLFDAYSVPVVVHRSNRYEAPRSAAAAAAVSNPCSLLLGESRSLSNRDVSHAVSGGRRRSTIACAAVAPPLVSTALSVQPQKQQQVARRAGTAAAAVVVSRSTSTTPAEAALLHARATVPYTRQDMRWKVQQLYTMSSLESREVYERTSHTMHVVTYRSFVSLWRTLDVFPSLMTAAATQQAYVDAATTTLLRGTCGSPGVVFDAAPQRHAGRKEGAALPPPSGLSAAAAAKAKAVRDKAIEELLSAHTGLTYPCFVEAFVRVAMTVFSHEVDRVAYPTSTAKTAGLMQWCNKQVCLGLVEQRTRKHLQNAAAAVASGGKADSLYEEEVGAGGGSRRSSTTASSPLATRSTASTGAFPSHLQLFSVPHAHRKKST